jgi:hypothetical protein
MNTKAAAPLALIGMITIITPVNADNAISVQITGTEVQNFCYFDGTAFSPGASICDPNVTGSTLTCQPKRNKLPVPPGSPPNTATLTSSVAGWYRTDDSKCAK